MSEKAAEDAKSDMIYANNFNVVSSSTTDGDEPKTSLDTTYFNDRTPPEERVARVAVDKSKIFKVEATKAAKEAEVSKSVANKMMADAHAF